MAEAKLLRALTVACFIGATHASAFSHFEARHCHPVAYTPDGARLLAVNAPEGRLAVFATSSAAIPPVLIAEIPVGLEPVTVRARTNDEAWVVNELSDSVSIISLSLGRVMATLATPDEPADVVFANGRAFVSCARSNRIAVFDAASHAQVGSIALEGLFPRSLTVSPDGTRVFTAFLLSGNNTTTLHFRDAPPQPAPTNPALPPAPQTALIVTDSDPRIPYDVIDHDVAEIDTTTLAVTAYRENLGTNLFALDCAPDGTLWAGASEARNLIRFEPVLNGIFAESRVIRIQPSAAPVIHDLNPHATAPVLAPSGKALSLAQPMAVLAMSDGAWVAAFGSDRLARLGPAGEVLARVDLRVSLPERVRGPRGLSRHPARGELAVLNKLSATVSIVDTTTEALVSEVPLSSHEVITAGQQRGRGFFFDARLSGNGTVSCGACHFDADHDGVAWDLGDPGGEMLVVTGYAPSIGQPGPVDRVLHPMKGPMVTQTLRGISGMGPFHWRGDRQSIQEFNSSFSRLQSGQQLAAADMDLVADYINSLRNHPNPNRLADNTLPVMLDGGDPAQGKLRFEQLNVCSKCHAGPRGTNHILDDFNSVLTLQPVENATLEHVYQKRFFTPGAATTLSGYGFTHDGTGRDIPRGHEYDQDRFHLYANAEADVMAYILCTETDTRPAVGLQSSTASSVLEARAAAGDCDLIAHAIVHGEPRSFLFDPITSTWRPDCCVETALTTSVLFATAENVSLTGVPPGNGAIMSIDRDGDGTLNRDRAAPTLALDASLQLSVQPDVSGWFVECSTDLANWTPLTPNVPAMTHGFFRLHRTW